MNEKLKNQACLLVQGEEHPGLVATIANLLVEQGGRIVTLNQHIDVTGKPHLVQRIVFELPDLTEHFQELQRVVAETLDPLGMNWRLTDQSVQKRMIVFASKTGYCLLDLLWRQQQGLLPVTIPMVISNHTNLEEPVRQFGVPFHHVPSSGADKSDAEERILELVKGQADFHVLARYMQILSPDFLRRIEEPIINIHHSFLPAFIGADPYRKAQERGVKLIGATAHYVTEDLDEGPIIEQETARVSHTVDLAGLRARGAIVERSVLSRAVRWHAEDRVIRDGNHTIIFE